MIIKLQKYNKINNYLINFLKNKKILYDLIYLLELVKLKILKTYIKVDLANMYIISLKKNYNFY